jgi:hypothetical protein
VRRLPQGLEKEYDRLLAESSLLQQQGGAARDKKGV